MPQSLTPEWQLELGEDALEVHAQYLHTLGNLTLTGSNSPMGNRPFAEKKQTLGQSNFALNKHFGNVDHWNREAILERSNILFETAIEIWSRPPISEAVAKHEDPTGSKPTHFRLFGIEYQATSWKGLYLKTLTLLAQRDGADKFMARAGTVTGSTRQYLSYTSEGMFSPAKIEGTGIWVETNLGSRSILSLIAKIMAACGHSPAEFQAFWD